MALRLRGKLVHLFRRAFARTSPVNAQFPGYYVGNTFGSVTNNVDVPVASYPLVTQPRHPGLYCIVGNLQRPPPIQGIQNRLLAMRM